MLHSSPNTARVIKKMSDGSDRQHADQMQEKYTKLKSENLKGLDHFLG